jgi:hypothetical protein
MSLESKLTAVFQEIGIDIKSLQSSIGGVSTIVGSANFDFGLETDSVVVTVNDAAINSGTIKSVLFVPVETANTSLDDFLLNRLSFNIQNIVNGVSFDIVANAQNEASGIYQINFKILY